MPEDPSPPDLISTDDIPLDEIAATNIIQPETITEALGKPRALFADARPLGLGIQATESSEAAILEAAVRPDAPRMRSVEVASDFGGFLSRSGEHGTPIYRRHGVLAVIALGALTLTAIITFPRTESTLESGLVVQADAPAPAAGSIGSNAGDGVDPIGAEGLFIRSKSERAATDRDLASIADSPERGTAADALDEVEAGKGESQGDESTEGDGGTDIALPPLPPHGDVDISVVVGPDTTEAPSGPGVTETTSEVVPTTQTPTTSPPAETTTTERRTTTTQRTTTTVEPENTTTTVETTTTTTEPEATTTTDPDATTTTVSTTTTSSSTSEPDDTTTTTATNPDGGPNEDPGSGQSPIVCADNPEACAGSTTTTTTTTTTTVSGPE